MIETKWRDVSTNELVESNQPRPPLRFYKISEMVTDPDVKLRMAVSAAVREWCDENPDALTIDRGLLRCGCCGERADTVHFLPWATDDVERVEFACPRHDADGYFCDIESMWTGPADFRDPRRAYSMVHHIIDTKGTRAIELWVRRLDNLKWVAAGAKWPAAEPTPAAQTITPGRAS